MNLLKALFNSGVEGTTFFDEAHPLTNDFLREDEVLAVVKSAIEPDKLGHVNFHGVRWRASCDRSQAITVGTPVRVLGRRANILVVEPAEEQVLRALTKRH
ncbi:MAG: NfeD family protein [Leptolyngbyaceae cyanobacterium]